MIKVAPQKENDAGSLINQAIRRRCAKLNRRHQMGGGKVAMDRRAREVDVGGDEKDDSEYAFGV